MPSDAASASRQFEEGGTVTKIPLSQAAASITAFCEATEDKMIPSKWGKLDEKENPYKKSKGGCTIL